MSPKVIWFIDVGHDKESPSATLCPWGEGHTRVQETGESTGTSRSSSRGAHAGCG